MKPLVPPPARGAAKGGSGLAGAPDRYADLCEFAPVGYLMLDSDGRVTDVDMTATAELGVHRTQIVGSPFERFIARADGNRWQRLAALALRQGGARCIELRLRRPDGRACYAQVDCLRVSRPGAQLQLRVTITDVSQRRLAETIRRIATQGNQAREAERRRVAHGLHEDLGQRLSGLKLELAALVRGADPSSMQATAELMATQLDEALAVVRRMSADLHPLILDNLGLNAALDWLVCDVANRQGLGVELRLDDDLKPDAASSIAIYRLAQTLLEHVAQRVTAGVTLELLQRAHDLVLQLRCEPGHARPGVPDADVIRVSRALKDQVHLLAGRLEVAELAPGLRCISVHLPVTAPAKR
jgi:two-component system sensor histidine kinase UhpB